MIQAMGMFSEHSSSEIFPIKTCSEDGRWPVEQLFSTFEQLVDAGWNSENIVWQEATVNGRRLRLPTLAFVSRVLEDPEPALWILGGVHGEEPAAPIALAQEVPTLITLCQRMPIVLLPILNPIGYTQDWRYPNDRRNFHRGQSVTDSEAYLSPLRKPIQEYVAPSEVSKHITGWILRKTQIYLPRLVFDHHEDIEDASDPHQFHSYVYFHGEKEFLPIAHAVLGSLRASGMPIVERDETRFGEEIVDGIVYNSIDGSVDELFASPAYVIGDSVLPKYPAPAVVVVETTRRLEETISLSARVAAHRNIIADYPRFWEIVTSVTHSDLV